MSEDKLLFNLPGHWDKRRQELLPKQEDDEDEDDEDEDDEDNGQFVCWWYEIIINYLEKKSFDRDRLLA